GHRFAWVLPAGTYTFYVGSDVRSAQAAGSVEVEETLVVEQLEQAAAPAADHPFERLARQEDESGTIVRGSEP
ncbi:Beta-glucosidase, partial [human gut metagenome]